MVGDRQLDIDDASDPLRVPREITTLRQQATDRLREAILDQRFRPGQRLIERELCERLGVSRTSVREALRHLESEGLIRTVPHKGPEVATISAAEARDIYQVRAALEGLAGELFATGASAAQIKQLKALAKELQVSCRRPDAALILETKTRFYDLICAGAGNAICADVIRSLNARIWLLRRMSITVPGRRETMLKEIRRIVSAAATRDPQATREACVAHVRSAEAAVLGLLANVAAEVEPSEGQRSQAKPHQDTSVDP